jgi:hypothetical protein
MLPVVADTEGVCIDVQRVADTRIAPAANNGLAHRLPGVGQVGAGLTRLPLEPFTAAAEALRAGSRREPVT